MYLYTYFEPKSNALICQSTNIKILLLKGPFVLPSNIYLIKIETNLALAGLNSAHVKF